MASSSEAFDLQPRADAVDIDLQCALAFSRSALKALVTLSEEASLMVDQCLADEIAATRLEDHAGSTAIEAILEDMRAVLKRSRDEHVRARELEDRLIEAMNALNGTGHR